jgi:hypothetical protein
VFDAVRGPVVLSVDVADTLGCSRETARRKLALLYDRGAVDRRKVSRRVVYWRDENAEDAARAAGGQNATQTPAGDRPPERVVESGDLDTFLETWEPHTETPPETARSQTRRAAEHLAATGDRLTRSDLVDALAADSSLGERSWWERAVRPGLRRLVDAGLVEYRSGFHDYKWTGEDLENADA